MKKTEFEKLFKTYLKKYSRAYVKKYLKEECTNLIREEIKYALSLSLLTEGTPKPSKNGAQQKRKPITSSKIRDEFAANYLQEQKEYDYETEIPDTLPAITLDINENEDPEVVVAMNRVANDPEKSAKIHDIFNKDYRETLKDMKGRD